MQTKYHGDGDPNSPIIQLELQEMDMDISTAGSDKRWWDFRELFNTREARYRFFQAFAMQWIGGWAGSALTSGYYAQMYKNAGITDPKTPLLITGKFYICLICSLSFR